MTKNATLFQLIKSMSKSEKRYFRLGILQEGSSNYLRLFDEIDKQDDYNEAAIKTRFAGEVFMSQLHVTKNYLYKLILRSLRNFHSGISRDARLKDGLRNIEILYNKELYRLCYNELSKLEKMARQYQLTAGSYELSVWRRKLDQISDPHNYDDMRRNLDQQEKQLSALSTTLEYWKLAVDVSGNIFGGEKNEIRQQHLLNKVEKATTLESKVLYYNTRYLLELDKDHADKAEKELRVLISHMEEYPEIIREEPGMYVSTINNLLSFLVYTKQYKVALDQIQEAKQIYSEWKLTSENRSLLKQILRTYNIELEIYRIEGTFELDYIQETEHFVLLNQYKMPKEYLMSFWFQLSSIYFMAGNYPRSLQWINRILNSRIKNVRIDLVVQTMFLNLVIHYEQQNLMVLRYFVDSTKRFLKKNDKVLPYEQLLLQLFMKLGQTPKSEHKDHFKRVKDNMFPSNGVSLVPEERIGYIDYEKWFEDHS